MVLPWEGTAMAENVTFVPSTFEPEVGAVTVTTGLARLQATVEDGVTVTLEVLEPPVKVT